LTLSVAACQSAFAMAGERVVASTGGSAIHLAFRDAEPILKALATRLCRHEADARDLVQDTFERALRQFDRDRPLNPRAWLATILHNLFIDRCRAQARRPAHEPLTDAADTAERDPEPEPAWTRVTLEDVRGALGEVEPDFRRVYEMHVFENRSYDEIASELGIQRVTVGTRLHRARHKLRSVLSQRVGVEVTR
jgi:RNA polymerase sigma-70 factor (ECF subfamily)